MGKHLIVVHQIPDSTLGYTADLQMWLPMFGAVVGLFQFAVSLL